MTILRKYLPLLIIILLFSCNKNADNKKEYAPEQNIAKIDLAEQEIASQKRPVKGWMNQTEFEETMCGDDTIAAEIVRASLDGKFIDSTRDYYDSSKTENVSEIDVIILAQGYYIQLSKGRSNGKGRAPEILVLSVKEENVYIKEIDLVEGNTITRHEILLQFDGKTFAHNRTKLEARNGNIQIVYLEHIPERPWRGPFEYEEPYIFAGSLDEPINDNVRKLTSDYIKTFTGYYAFDSGKILRSSNEYFSLYHMRINALKIEYNQELKCLTLLFSEAYSIKESAIDFIETDNERVFYWLFGEGAGYTDVRFFFHKGGIVYCRDHSSYGMEDGEAKNIVYEEYVVFFKKEE
jgi:hypothetical protein